MNRQDTGTVALIVTAITGAIVCFVLLASLPSVSVSAQDIATQPTQDTAPAWEYAALAYDGDTAFAFTGDLAANNEINKIYDAMNPDTMTSISVMNVLGERGWEYIDYQPGSPVVYMFRKPLR
jgi:hypothetical protein